MPSFFIEYRYKNSDNSWTEKFTSFKEYQKWLNIMKPFIRIQRESSLDYFYHNETLQPNWKENMGTNSTVADQRISKIIASKALSSSILVVAISRPNGWCAYIKNVPGKNHHKEKKYVVMNGTKLEKELAEAMFPQYKGIGTYIK